MIILTVFSIVVAIAAGCLSYHNARQLRKLIDHVKNIQQKSNDMDNMIAASFTASAAMTEHMARTDLSLRRLAERQDQYDLRDSVNQSYNHAIKMVRNGASIDELIDACGLVRGEAELLLRLHGNAAHLQ